jgi:hypothetical protein
MKTYTNFVSSNVKSLAYDEAAKEVFVTFKDKAGNATSTHAYRPIPEDTFTDRILNAPSVGSAVHQFLVKGTCERRKIS